MRRSHQYTRIGRSKARSAGRAVSAAVLSAVALAVTATPAFANWESYIQGASSGFQSHRWSDTSYSQVKFQECVNGYDDSVGVDMREDINNLPDKDYGTKTFTNCFNGWNYTSNGQWSGLESGNYFFQLKNMSGLLAVSTVYQDTTKDDSGSPDPI